jgi:hypothetical protein
MHDGRDQNAYKILVENLRGGNHLRGLGVYLRIILIWTLNRVGSCGLDSSGSGHGPLTGSSNEPWGSIKGGEFLD